MAQIPRNHTKSRCRQVAGKSISGNRVGRWREILYRELLKVWPTPRPNQLAGTVILVSLIRFTMIELSALISAVKPKERTDQYMILAALFALGAHNASVTARNVVDKLKLHLGKDTPTNVSASLRAYTAYVSPAEEGPPLR